MSSGRWWLLALGLVVAGAMWAIPSPKVETREVVLRGEFPHVSLDVTPRRPRVMEWAKVTARVRGEIGKGNTMCLTAWWMVDAQGVWKEGKRYCGPPFDVIERQYQFFNPGEYVVLVSVRFPSGREFDQKHVFIEVLPAEGE